MNAGARNSHDRGFSLLELLVSAALILVVASAAGVLLGSARAALQAEPETSDMQQRLRVAAGTLQRDLIMAGAGSYGGPLAGPLTYFFAPVMPFRQGLRLSDPPGTFKTDTITLLYVPQTAAQTIIAQPLAAQSADVTVATGPGCPVGDPVCGFTTGATALVFDHVSYDLFTVTSVQPPRVHLQHNLRDVARTYNAGTKIVQVASRTYYLKSDAATGTFQLVQYDGGNGSDVPVVDHVVALQFEYYADPQPPIMSRPVTDPSGPWTTYGPKPPIADAQPTGYPPGENCVFAANGTTTPVPRLPALGSDTALVKLTAGQLTDGPWCPDPTDPNRYDADLLRIRRISVVLRVEAALDALRGPAGVLFTRAGLARAGNRLVPDSEVRIDVAPRNLTFAR